MSVHHIIPKHEWKVRFGNLRGVNAPDNLSPPLYTHQHAQVHTHYFNEITHIEYDRIAGLAISGQIGKEEANRLAIIFTQTGNQWAKGIKHTSEQNTAKSLWMMGKQHGRGNKGKRHTPEQNATNSLRYVGKQFGKGYKGKKHTEEWKQRMSKFMEDNQYGRGYKHTPEENASKSLWMMGKQNGKGHGAPIGNQNGKGNKGNPGPQPKVTCSYCPKTGGLNAMKRWHFDKCKFKV